MEIVPHNRAEAELHDLLAGKYLARYRGEFARVFSDCWNLQFTAWLPKRCELVLDCGCGTGDLTRVLRKHAELTVGADISGAMLEAARAELGDDEGVIWAVCPGECLPFADRVFDAVCFRGALHHMADERAALAEAYRVLKPGGRLVLSEPNGDSLVLFLPRLISRLTLRRFSNRHKSFRSRRWLKTIAAAGFTVEYCRYFSFLSEPLCGMSDILPIMKSLPAAGRIAQAMVRIDDALSRVPMVRRQSFEFIVAAAKGRGA